MFCFSETSIVSLIFSSLFSLLANKKALSLVALIKISLISLFLSQTNCCPCSYENSPDTSTMYPKIETILGFLINLLFSIFFSLAT
ncbi:Uncharacterised protein [Chlamydia trachomatis]|nr:Uncharacterised protein [Chlamydia trachomatis]